MKIKESDIRKSVAQNLELFDGSLKLVKEEYPIKMSDGRRGYVDILAKDKFGCYTIIEIKKSNQTARSAVQQLYKYASFFKEKNRLETSQIRCVVISTVWDELNSPFSEFREFSDYDVKGYELTYNQISPPAFKEVNPEFIIGNNKPLSNFLLFRYATKTVRDKNLEILKSILKSIPSLNNIMFSLNLTAGQESVGRAYDLEESSYAIAWVVFTGNVTAIDSEVSLLESRSEPTEVDEYLYTLENGEDESELRSRIANLYLNVSTELDSYKGYAPHTLNNLDNICDYDIGPILRGPMFDDSLYTIGEAIDMAHGINGLHPYIFICQTTPQRDVHFNTTRQDVNLFLKSNLRWTACVNLLFSELEQTDELDIQIYNPLNIFGLFNDLFVEGRSERIPHIKAKVTKASGEEYEYLGALIWDPAVGKLNAMDGINKSYPDINTFRIRSVINTITKFDEELSTYCGLTYGLLNLTSDEYYSIDDQKWLPNMENEIKIVNDFIAQNNDFIIQVGSIFKKYEIGVGNGTNMVMVDNS